MALNQTSSVRLLLLNQMGYVVPATKHQFGSLDEDVALTNQIARAVGEEIGIEMALRAGKHEWLPEMQHKVDEAWEWVETCLVQNREMFSLKQEQMS